ncbi:MAG TPA: hypothetical protein VNK26_08005 [Pyrinomonadaceae bacterium]|nr:hypothetical protein [Pyrinomonadaceae bacterium]
MLKVFLILFFILGLCVFSVAGQTKVEKPSADPEFMDQKYWSQIGKPIEGPRGFSLFSRNIHPLSDTLFELWVKVIPNYPDTFNRRNSLPKNLSYYVMFAKVDCDKRLVGVQQISGFDSNGARIELKETSLASSENLTKVKPGSVNEVLFNKICRVLE